MQSLYVQSFFASMTGGGGRGRPGADGVKRLASEINCHAALSAIVLDSA
jgi:hypothetical protein